MTGQPPLALEICNLSRRFGGLVATDDLSLKLPQGARLALIGPNGAGKTTLVNQITGILRPDRGRILLEGHDITRLSAGARVRRGLARTFQINQLFAAFRPAEAIALTLAQHQRRGLWRGLGQVSGITDRTASLLADFGLAEVMDIPTHQLSYGKQRLLEIAIALAAAPRVLLLDEPAAGVSEAERSDILAVLARLPREVAIILIEHDMDLVFSFADQIAVMVNGALLAQGAPVQIRSDPRVRAAYLGGVADV